MLWNFEDQDSAWQIVTNVKKESQGLVLALNLHNEANSIGELIFLELSIDDLKG